MAVTPRASGLWEGSLRMSGYFDDTDGAEDPERLGDEALDDGRTPLDRTIDRIGMGTYQWTLLSLCGFGWMADNMWIQAVAIILPRVQQHYSVPDNYIGVVSSAMFAGMMFGAIGWGTCSDVLGRSTAFNATLFFTSVFGILAGLATTFPLLCIALFLLGSAVGGSMPTDGTLLLEHMPRGKEYLVTALSVFFSFGAVLAALVAIAIIPQHSCLAAPAVCDPADNQGWRYELMALGAITLTMFCARMVFFRLHESPRYLVHAGRPQAAIESLQLISRFNGSELELDLEDVIDHHDPAERAPRESIHEENTPLFDADAQNTSPERSNSHASASSGALDRQPTPPDHYHATGESETGLRGHFFRTPTSSLRGLPRTLSDIATPDVNTFKELGDEPDAPVHDRTPSRRPPRPGHSRMATSASMYSTFEEAKAKVWWRLPRSIRKPLGAWIDRFAMVLSPDWIGTTFAVWGAWFGMSLAYTMFNVYLPKLLEARSAKGAEPKSLEGTLWDVVIFTLGGCPGAVLGAYLIESKLGRRLSLAGSTFITAVFCVMFIVVDGQFAMTASTVGISLSATTMWAVLYGWTPEIFSTKVRGTACGAASALSRIGGMIAPVLGGVLFMVDLAFPVYTSIVVFGLSGACVLLLKEDAGVSQGGGRAALVH
ncbi:MFS general substrate transporter [Peniophora sp. CONT]|nr:MFS general substrate transporter [Peniophora sp. CONT]